MPYSRRHTLALGTTALAALGLTALRPAFAQGTAMEGDTYPLDSSLKRDG